MDLKRVTAWVVLALLYSVVAASPSPGQEAEKIAPAFEELFLGEILYPQNRGEIQLTTGFLWNHRGHHDSRLPVLVEYGITDYFQLEATLPVDFQRSGPTDATGIGNIELGAYYNFLNRPETGTGLGFGFEVGFPEATDGVSHDAFIYEPFFVAYQEFGSVALNVSAGVEIEDPREAGEEHEVAGDISVAVFRRYGEFIPLIELGLEIEDGATEARLAPGVYWKPPCWKDAEVGVAFPIGLTAEAPNFGAFLQLTIEFEPDEDEDERESMDLD